MMDDPLVVYQMRVKAARINGEMPDYVRDVSALVAAMRFAYARIGAFEERIDKARKELAILRQQARHKDTIDTRSNDYQLMLAGAERIVLAFDGDD